jgi:hypothetical protein
LDCTVVIIFKVVHAHFILGGRMHALIGVFAFLNESSRVVRNIEDVVDPLVEEDDLIILSYYDAVVVEFDQIFKLILLTHVSKSFTVYLDEGSCEGIEEDEGN